MSIINKKVIGETFSFLRSPITLFRLMELFGKCSLKSNHRPKKKKFFWECTWLMGLCFIEGWNSSVFGFVGLK